MSDFEEHVENLNIKSIVITMILSAFGFLVALAWRDAIKESIDLFVPTGEGVFYTYVAAILVTVIAVVVTFVLIKIQKTDIIPDRLEKRDRKKVKKSVKRR